MQEIFLQFCSQRKQNRPQIFKIIPQKVRFCFYVKKNAIFRGKILYFLGNKCGTIFVYFEDKSEIFGNDINMIQFFFTPSQE